MKKKNVSKYWLIPAAVFLGICLLMQIFDSSGTELAYSMPYLFIICGMAGALSFVIGIVLLAIEKIRN